MHALMHGAEFWYSLKMTAQRLAHRNFEAVAEFLASLPETQYMQFSGFSEPSFSKQLVGTPWQLPTVLHENFREDQASVPSRDPYRRHQRYPYLPHLQLNHATVPNSSTATGRVPTRVVSRSSFKYLPDS